MAAMAAVLLLLLLLLLLLVVVIGLGVRFALCLVLGLIVCLVCGYQAALAE